jgi:uncharacterized protein (TIGR03382 family)
VSPGSFSNVVPVAPPPSSGGSSSGGGSGGGGCSASGDASGLSLLGAVLLALVLARRAA